MLGIAARSSIIVDNRERNLKGHSSFKNSALPRASGTPKRTAMNDVASVPTIEANAPNLFDTGFQELAVMNENPNLWNTGTL